MPTLLYKDTTLVKGVGFDSWRRVGSLMQSVKVYNMRQVDELVFLDITATVNGVAPDFSLIDDFADECFMPLAVGGGIRTVEDVRKLLSVGADKVVVNTIVATQPQIVSEIARRFGSQCVVVSIDYRLQNGRAEVFTHCGARSTGLDAIELSQRVASLGAGEILLTSIDRDGSMTGYDIDTIRKVSDSVNIPVIASGGAGNFVDMQRAIAEGHAQAVAAASMFHFTEQTPMEAKEFLRSCGIPTRI